MGLHTGYPFATGSQARRWSRRGSEDGRNRRVGGGIRRPRWRGGVADAARPSGGGGRGAEPDDLHRGGPSRSARRARGGPSQDLLLPGFGRDAFGRIPDDLRGEGPGEAGGGGPGAARGARARAPRGGPRGAAIRRLPPGIDPRGEDRGGGRGARRCATVGGPRRRRGRSGGGDARRGIRGPLPRAPQPRRGARAGRVDGGEGGFRIDADRRPRGTGAGRGPRGSPRGAGGAVGRGGPGGDPEGLRREDGRVAQAAGGGDGERRTWSSCRQRHPFAAASRSNAECDSLRTQAAPMRLWTLPSSAARISPSSSGARRG